MRELLSEEFYKLIHKRGTWYTPIILSMAMLAVGFMARHSPDAQWYITAAFAGTEWAIIIMVMVCATTISMEYEYGTIKHLVIEDKGKVRIFLSKFSIIILYDAYLHLLAFGFTLPIKWLMYGGKYSFSANYEYSQSLMSNLINECLIDFLGSIVIIGAALLLSCAAKSAAVAIASGITVIFIGQGVSMMLLRNVGRSIPLLRWNPFNMLNMPNEWSNPAYYENTLLTIKQLMIGNIGYSILFILAAFLMFERKRI